MELEAPLDAFAREQRAGLGALARLSRPGDRAQPVTRDPDPPESRDWDPPLRPPRAGRVRPYVTESGAADGTFGSRSYWP
jgi:hypothetical protein